MTYLERKELESLSLQVFGSRTRYAKLLKGHYVENVKSYPTLAEVKQFMQELVVMQEKNIKLLSSQAKQNMLNELKLGVDNANP